MSLGICRTRTIAERAAAEKLEQLGINSTRTFIESTSTLTFKQQGEIWLKSLASRKRNPLEQTTIVMKEFIEHISGLSPATIRDYSNMVKAVVASAINEDGECLFPRTWNEEGMESILREATGQYRVLYALLVGARLPLVFHRRRVEEFIAGCGPLRAGEALGLEIGKHISEDCRTLYIQQKAKRGKIQAYLKTKNGEREVDVCMSLAAMMKDHVGARTSGLCSARQREGNFFRRTPSKTVSIPPSKN
jgi:hypothetical protein